MPHDTQGSPDQPYGVEDLEPFFEGLFYVSPDGVVVSDAGGTIRIVSDRAAALFGYTADELVGTGIDQLVPARDRGAHASQRESYLHDPAPRMMGEARELFGLRKDGSMFPADISLSTIETRQETLVVAMVRDISSRARLTNLLRREQAQLRGANDTARAILAGEDVESVLHIVISNARDVAAAAMGAILCPEHEADVFTVRVLDGDGLTVGLEIPTSDGILDEIVDRQRSLILERSPQGWAEVLPAGLGPTIVVPVPSAASPGCLLAVANRAGGRRFSRTDLSAVESVANQAAVAMDFAAMRADLQQLAVMEERERIAMDLHDGIIQELFGTAMALQSAERVAVKDQVIARLVEAAGRIDKVIADLRSYIYGLHEARTEQSPLDATLRKIATAVQEQSGIVVAVDVDPVAAAAVQVHADALRHIAREGLSNAVRHAHAHSARVSLRFGPGRDVVVLEIDDDGRGFDPVAAAGVGEGLRNLEKRSESAGGTLTIESRPGRGTSLRILLPVV